MRRSLFALALVALAGCGTEAVAGTAAPRLGDDRWALTLVAGADDFGWDWTSAPAAARPTDGALGFTPGALATCLQPAVSAAGGGARAATGDQWLRERGGQKSFVTSAAFVAPDAAAAEALAAALGPDAVARCLAAELSEARPYELGLPPPLVAPAVSAPAPGTSRITATVGEANPAPVVVDLVLLRAGRGVALLYLAQAGGAFLDVERDGLVGFVSGRLAADPAERS